MNYNEREKRWLERATDEEGYLLGYVSMICLGDYVYMVGSHYKTETADAKERLLPVIAGKMSRTVAKGKTNRVSSSRKCHAATVAGRR